jgi:hypothetical protein
VGVGLDVVVPAEVVVVWPCVVVVDATVVVTPGVDVVDVGLVVVTETTVVVVVGVTVVVEVDPPPARAMTGAMGETVGTTVVMPEGVTVLLG